MEWWVVLMNVLFLVFVGFIFSVFAIIKYAPVVASTYIYSDYTRTWVTRHTIGYAIGYLVFFILLGFAGCYILQAYLDEPSTENIWLVSLFYSFLLVIILSSILSPVTFINAVETFPNILWLILLIALFALCFSQQLNIAGALLTVATVWMLFVSIEYLVLVKRIRAFA